MRKLLLLHPVVFFFFYFSVNAQKDNSDSLNLVSKIQADSARLRELQSELDLKMMSKQEAIARAHRSASENVAAADRLSDDPRNKRLAKRADKNAGEARRDAKNARLETEKVDKLDKEIRRVQKRLAKNQSRLSKYIQRGYVQPATPDTSQQ
ncbi:hypothetical protein [Longitalea luteola]|uniref:hypothetical protein n=1 Tax=Longitalea luteola TaxID=2812563 RepID=UPI001A9733CC|nr:hypothetical protein [Longitalea luteola]